MRAVYFIMWLILTALVCYWLYELKESKNSLRSNLESVQSSQDIQIIDEVSGSTYTGGDSSDQDSITSTDSNSDSNLDLSEKKDPSTSNSAEANKQVKNNISSSEREVDYLQRAYIEFNQNSVTLPKGGKFGSYLDSVANVVSNGDYKIVLEGHADKLRSSQQNNYQVGIKRAQFIKDLLIKRNVPEEKIEIISKGDTEPRMPGDTPEARELNRRVELFIKQKN